MAGRPGWAGCVVQWRAMSWRCQRRIVVGVTSSPESAADRQQSGECGDHGAIGPGHPRARRSSLEHGELVAQDQDLDLLGGVGSSAQHGPAQELREHLVDQPRRHQRIMPDYVPPGERAGQGLCAQFSALTGSLVFRSFLALSLVRGTWDTPVRRGSWILGCERDSIDRSCTVLVRVIRRTAPPHRARWPVCLPSFARALPLPHSRPSSGWWLV
jgi:hypothetical protein